MPEQAEKKIYAVGWALLPDAAEETMARGNMFTLHSSPTRALMFYRSNYELLTLSYQDPVSANMQGQVALRLTTLTRANFGNSKDLFDALAGSTAESEKTGNDAFMLHKFAAPGQLNMTFINPAFGSALNSGDLVFADTGRVTTRTEPPPAPEPPSASRRTRRVRPKRNPGG